VPIYFTTGEEHCAVASETSIVLDNKGCTGCRETHAKCSGVILHCDEYGAGSRSHGVCNDDVAADYSRGMEKESSEPLSSIVGGSEVHRDGELIPENYSENVDIIVHATPNTAVNCFRTTVTDMHHTVSAR